MITRPFLARVLVAFYPLVWRREYGPELTEILVRRAITFSVIANVIGSALWQRGRTVRPSTVLGLVSMSVVLGRFMLTPTALGPHWTTLLQPVATTFPPVAIMFVTADVYVLCMVGCGCWTYLRDAGPLRASAIAAMRMSLIAGVPIMVYSLMLMFGGAVDLMFIGSQRVGPLPWLMLISPVLRLPEGWIWGIVGGLLGRWLTRSRQPAVALRG